MRVFLVVFFLIFSLQFWTKADDISGFEIEGMSIGDSVLDFFSEDEIDEIDDINKANFKNDSIKGIRLDDISWFKIFESVQLVYKQENWEIINISAIINFSNNINACLKKKDSIVEVLSAEFTDYEIDNIINESHKADKTGNSKITTTYFNFPDKNYAAVSCTDWTEEMSFSDLLKVRLSTDEYNEILKKEYE